MAEAAAPWSARRAHGGAFVYERRHSSRCGTEALRWDSPRIVTFLTLPERHTTAATPWYRL